MRIFISYSHEDENEKKVLRLSESLREHGLECEIDQYINDPTEGWAKWMVNQIKNSDKCIIVHGKSYYNKYFSKTKSGIALEAKMLTDILYEDGMNSDRVKHVIFQSSDRSYIPEPFKGYNYFTVDSNTGYKKLYASLTGQEFVNKNQIGSLVDLTEENKNKEEHFKLGDNQDNDNDVIVDARMHMDFKIPGDFSKFDEAKKQKFLNTLIKALELDSDKEIKIVNVRGGSVQITIELSPDIAERLQMKLLSGDIDMDILEVSDPYEVSYTDSPSSVKKKVNTPILIKTRNLKKFHYTDEIETTVLAEINLEIRQGEFIAIMGPSGSGKSTLLNILGLLDNPTEGEFYFSDKEVSYYSERQRADLRKANIGFIFQSFNLIDELTVFENIELPLIYLKYSSSERKKRVEEVMEQMGIMHRMHHFPQQLSGGQQQRVAISRAVVTKPKLILADEPTGNLDSANGAEVMNVLTDLNEAGSTIVVVTHSPVDAEYAHRILHLFDGQIVSENIIGG